MANIFDKLSDIDVRKDEIQHIFHAAWRHPYDFIRINLEKNDMRLYYKHSHPIYIREAMVFIQTENDFPRMLFFQHGKTEDTFYGVIRPKRYMAYTMTIDGQYSENRFLFEAEEKFLVILEGDEATTFIGYDGTKKRFGYLFSQEAPDSPNLYDLVKMALVCFKNNPANLFGYE